MTTDRLDNTAAAIQFCRKCFGVRRCFAAFKKAFSTRKSLSSGANLITLIPCPSRQSHAICIKLAAELLAHETNEMTRKEEIMELIYKDESYAIRCLL